MTEWTRRAGAFLLGRKTYEVFAASWPRSTDPADEIATALTTGRQLGRSRKSFIKWRSEATMSKMGTVESRDGTTLAYDIYGSGPALIYITGASCYRSFFPVVQDAKAFAKQFTVYNYDRRGRGDSTDTQPYAIDREVEDIEALIDAAGGRASLYGHSSGAVLALEAALLLGEKIDKCMTRPTCTTRPKGSSTATSANRCMDSSRTARTARP